MVDVSIVNPLTTSKLANKLMSYYNDKSRSVEQKERHALQTEISSAQMKLSVAMVDHFIDNGSIEWSQLRWNPGEQERIRIDAEVSLRQSQVVRRDVNEGNPKSFRNLVMNLLSVLKSPRVKTFWRGWKALMWTRTQKPPWMRAVGR